ncbi:MAG: hypothetical protein ACFFD4_39790, partial [Candidatus Odinarchaeota archaeon]
YLDMIKRLKEEIQGYEIHYEQELKQLTAKNTVLANSIMEQTKHRDFLQANIIKLLLQESNQQLNDNREEIKVKNRREMLLRLLPNYIAYLKVETELSRYERQLQEKTEPIDEQLQVLAAYIVLLLEREKKQLIENHVALKQRFDANDKLYSQLIENAGGMRKEVENIESGTSKLTKKIKKIEKQTEHYQELLDEGEAVSEAVKRMTTTVEALMNHEILVEDQLQEKESAIEEKEQEREKAFENEGVCRERVNKLNNYLERAKQQWKVLVTSPIVEAELSGSTGNLKDINHSILTTELFTSITKDHAALEKLIRQKAFDHDELSKKLSFYEEEEHLPYPEDVSLLQEFLLKEYSISSWNGWEYIQQYELDPECKVQMITDNPYLFDGLILADYDPEKLLELKEKLNKSSIIEKVQSPVPLLSTQYFRDQASGQISTHRYWAIITPDLKWKYDQEEILDYIQRLRVKKEEISGELTSLERKLQYYQQTAQDYHNFFKHYPEEEYFKKKSDFEEASQELSRTSHELYESKVQLEELKEDKKKLEVRLKELQEEYKKNNDTLTSLKLFEKDEQQKREYEKDREELTSKYESLSKELTALNEQRTKIKSEIDTQNQEIKELEKRLAQNGNHLSRYSARVSKEREEGQLDVATSKNLDVWMSEYQKLETERDYLLKEDEIGRQARRLRIEKDELDRTINELLEFHRLKKEELVVFHSENSDLTEVSANKQITILKSEIESIKLANSDLERVIKSYKEQFSELKASFLTSVQDLRLHYEMILEKKEHLQEQLEKRKKTLKDHENTLAENEARAKEYQVKIDTFSENLRDIEFIEYLKQDYNSLCQLGYEPSLITYSEETQELESLKTCVNEQRARIASFSASFIELLGELKTYSEQFRSLKRSVNPRIQDLGLVKYAEEFTIKNILEINVQKKRLEVRIEEVELKIKEHESRIETVSTVFKATMNSAVAKIIILSEIKSRIPSIPHLNNRKLLDIKFRDKSTELLESEVTSYFSRLFGKNEIPQDLTVEQIIRDILYSYIDLQVKNIHYLFPNKSRVEYRTIKGVRGGSGGERLTIAIYIYSLLASFRQKYSLDKDSADPAGTKLSKSGKLRRSFFLLMDNPIGKVSRPDLIQMQIALADELNVQLILLTHIFDAEAAGRFSTFHSITKTVDDKVIIDDKHFYYDVVRGSRTSIHPKLLQKPRTLLDFMDETKLGTKHEQA